jgi:outer membrane protein TolC
MGFLLDMPVFGKLQVPQSLLEAASVQPSLIETEVPVVLKRRLDLQVMQLHARAARSGILSPTLKWLPSISLTGQYRYTNEAGLTGQSTNWNVGLSMSWSLFDGLNRNADYREKRALTRIAELDAQAARRRSELEVRGAWVSVANQQAVLKQAQVAFSVAEKNARETAELYRQGLASALASADANVRLFESEVAMVNAQYGLALVFLNLRAAQGLDPFGKEPQA